MQPICPFQWWFPSLTPDVENYIHGLWCSSVALDSLARMQRCVGVSALLDGPTILPSSLFLCFQISCFYSLDPKPIWVMIFSKACSMRSHKVLPNSLHVSLGYGDLGRLRWSAKLWYCWVEWCVPWTWGVAWLLVRLERNSSCCISRSKTICACNGFAEVN